MNIYDDQDFFTAYAGMARSRGGLEAAGEWHQLRRLFPDLSGKRVLDMGCGYGWHSEYAARMGAAYVLGIDASARMLEEARARHSHERVEYRQCGIETYAFPADEFDFVFSNLVLHYVENLEPVYRGVYRTLRVGGVFLFNIEHPSFTAGVRQEWIRDESGEALYWPLDRYFSAGKRETVFLGKTVEKQHHTLTQILNPLIHMGFRLEAVEEAEPSEEMRNLPEMRDELRRPMMLLVRARKD